MQNSITTTRYYHDAGLLLGESYSGGTLSGLRLTNTFDSFLRRTGVSSLNGSTVLSSTTYGYDNASRVSSVSDGTYSGNYSYVANSPLVSQIDYKQNSTVRMTTTKQHDYLNRLLSIASHPGGSLSPASLSFSYQYNDGNQRIRTTLADGSYWLYEYDTLGQVESGKRYWSDHTPVAGQQNEYTHDDIGNRLTTNAGGDENGANLRSATYTYNSRNQYTARTVPNTFDVLGIANLASTVTVNGNSTYRKGEYFRKELNVANSSAAVWMGVSVQALNGGSSNTVSGNVFVAQTSESPTYDADGNLTQDGRWTLTWDAENRLTQAESLSGNPTASKRKVIWETDCRGRRIRQTTYDGSSGSYGVTEDLKFLFDGLRCVAELNATNNAVVRSYAWGLDLSGSLDGAGGVGGLVWMNSVANGVHFHAMDGNGNVAALVKGTDGTVTANYEYDVFGQTLRVSGTMAAENRYQFSTKRCDKTTDFLLYEYRPYSPSLGRFLNRDPIEEKGGLNLYAFVSNDAVGFVDALGLHVYTVDVTAKSWIAEPVTAGWVSGMNPFRYPLLLSAVAQVELLTSDLVVNDAIDGRYRFLSQKTISVDCCGSTLESFNFSALFTDIGIEGGIFIPPETVVADDRGYRGSASSVRFTWMVKARPNPLAEAAVFNPVRNRTSVYIWHRIIGAIRCVDGKPSVSLSMMNSQFPSADAYYRIDGGPLTPAASYGQKAMARLWDADPGDPTLVK